MSAPHEVNFSIADVYLAPVAEAYPDVDETPAGNWVKLGTAGRLDYDEDGVRIRHSQTIAQKRALGTTGPRKVARTEEGLEISLILLDTTAEEYAKALNHATVTDTAAGAGTPGYRHFSMLQGRTVTEKTLLVRVLNSAYDNESYAGQYEVTKVFVSSEPEVVWSKGEPAGIAITFTAIEDATNGFGEYVMQDAVAV